MIRIAFLLPLLLASCDIFYGVERTTQAPSGFSPEEARVILESHPTCSRFIDRNGWLQADFLEGRAQATFFHDAKRGELDIGSVWTGRPPDIRTLIQSIELQERVIESLRTRFPVIPPASEWDAVWMNMEAQPAAAAARTSRGS